MMMKMKSDDDYENDEVADENDGDDNENGDDYCVL